MNKNKGNKTLGIGIALTAFSLIGGTILKHKISSSKKRKMLEQFDYNTGVIRKFGTLYLNGQKYKRPCDLENFEDMPKYEEGSIEIRKSDRNDDYVLSWVEIVHNGKKILVCDRNILINISWDELNNQGLVYGKIVTINGVRYLLRLLTSGDKKNKDSEWDRYIINDENILDLPIPVEEDLKDLCEENYLKHKDGESNKLWNWHNLCSFTQNDYHISNKFAVIKGFYSVKSTHYANKSKRYDTIGYRPVLELLD